ncbi:MAG: OmpA family protein [Candidatus Zixiibacteriota bacterium]
MNLTEKGEMSMYGKQIIRAGLLVLLACFVLAAPAARAIDSDGDGLPDDLDRRPHVASYFMAPSSERANPAMQPATVDSDADGVPDMNDNRPYLAEYINMPAGPRVDPTTQPNTVDSDMDGVPDYLDNRPYVLEYYMAPMGPRVDPLQQPPDVDSDQDGVPDVQDNRPYVAEYYKPLVAAMVEKPVVKETPKDSDGDGVTDEADKCPRTPAGVRVDASGCPIDSDGDGVTDNLDKCPNTPTGAPVDAVGCPKDSDGDGVADYLDKCPGTPAGIPVDETGCPKIIKKGEKITLHINFPTNSYEIDLGSQRILDGVAQTMQSFPEINIRVGGFTDNTGGSGYNQRLSENRAKAVVSYLEGKGVPSNRMSSKGYGENPQYFIGDNNTDEGKAQNRRVEIESVE